MADIHTFKGDRAFRNLGSIRRTIAGEFMLVAGMAVAAFSIVTVLMVMAAVAAGYSAA